MYPFHSTPHRYPSAPPTLIRKPCVPEAALRNTRVYIGMSELGKEPFKWGPPKSERDIYPYVLKPLRFQEWFVITDQLSLIWSMFLNSKTALPLPLKIDTNDTENRAVFRYSLGMKIQHKSGINYLLVSSSTFIITSSCNGRKMIRDKNIRPLKIFQLEGLGIAYFFYDTLGSCPK